MICITKGRIQSESMRSHGSMTVGSGRLTWG